MRVAVVSPYDPRPQREDDPRAICGGVEEALDRLASGLAGRGHDVTVVCSAERDADERAGDGVRFIRVRRRAVVFRNPIAPLWRHVPADTDVVHVPATYPFFSDYLPWRESRRGRATVLDYHFDVHGTSVAMRVAAAAYEQTLGRLMHRATRIVCKSKEYAAHSRVLGRLPPERLDWVPNAVDVDLFRLKTSPGKDILCVGRLVPYKGVETLVRAMPTIHQATGARLRLVGDGPERETLERLAHELHAPIDFLGRVPRSELLDLYVESRLTVLPSANSQEAFGITLLESMASGTPVVASDLPGPREVARLGGLTARPNDPRALADAVGLLYEAPHKVGTPQELRERVRERYSWPAVVESIERVYESALQDVERDGRGGSKSADARSVTPRGGAAR